MPTMTDAQASLDKAIEGLGRARKAQTDILEAVGADEKTGVVKLDKAADKLKWEQAEADLLAYQSQVHSARADMELVRHEREAEDLAQARDDAAKKDELQRGKGGDAAVGLGAAMLAITKAGGSASKAGEFTLPPPAIQTKMKGGRLQNSIVSPKATDMWDARDDGNVLLAEGLRSSVALARDLPPGTNLDISKGTTGATGGLEVTTEPVMQQMFDDTAILRVAKVLNTQSGTNVNRRKRRAIAGTADATHPAGAGVALIVAEGGAIQVQDPTWGSVTQGAYKIGYQSRLTYEVTVDLSPGDLEREVASDGATGLGQGMAYYAASGSGSGQPEGIRFLANIPTVTGSAGVAGDPDSFGPTANELIQMRYMIRTGYRNLIYMGLHQNWGSVRMLAQASDSTAPLWTTDAMGEWDGYLDGIPVLSSHGFARYGDDVKNAIVVGDWMRFEIRLAGGMRINRSDEVGWVNDELAWRFLQRMDCHGLDETAFVGFNCRNV